MLISNITGSTQNTLMKVTAAFSDFFFLLSSKLDPHLQERITYQHSSSCQHQFNIKNLKLFYYNINLLEVKFQFTGVSLYNGKYKF